MRTLAAILFAMIATILIVGCAGPSKNTTLAGGFDKTFTIKEHSVIGFVPQYWLSKEDVKIRESNLYALAKSELEARGYQVVYIAKEHIKKDSSGNLILIGLEKMPDLTITVVFGERKDEVYVPGSSSSSAGVAGEYGGASSSSHEGYNTTAYTLGIKYDCWEGAPKFQNKIWEGEISKSSPVANLDEEMRDMVTDLFWKQWGRY